MPVRAIPSSLTSTRHSVKPYLNLDHVVAFGVNAAYQAMHGWLRGRPLDEIALLNRLTENLRYAPCPEWPQSSRSTTYALRRNLFILHHKGGKASGDKGGTDAYGADLAITLNIFSKPSTIDGLPGPSVFSKTALFQLKSGKKFRPHLERRQLKQARNFSDYSFVLYADEDAAELRIQSTQKVLAHLPAEPDNLTEKEKPHLVHTQNWQTLAEWLVSWLTCQVGKFSTDGQRQIIEQALGRFSIWREDSSVPFIRFQQNNTNSIQADFEGVAGFINSDLPLAASWLVIDIYSSASSDDEQ